METVDPVYDPQELKKFLSREPNLEEILDEFNEALDAPCDACDGTSEETLAFYTRLGNRLLTQREAMDDVAFFLDEEEVEVEGEEGDPLKGTLHPDDRAEIIGHAFSVAILAQRDIDHMVDVIRSGEIPGK